MTFDQRQRALADRAEADHHNRSGDGAVNGPCGHCRLLVVRILLLRITRARWNRDLETKSDSRGQQKIAREKFLTRVMKFALRAQP
jgi:hypothetical protein